MDASDMVDNRFKEKSGSQRSLRDGFARKGGEKGLDEIEEVEKDGE